MTDTGERPSADDLTRQDPPSDSPADPAARPTGHLPVLPETVSSPVSGDDPHAAAVTDGVADLPREVQQVVDALPAGSALLVTGLGTGLVQRFLLDEEKLTAGRHPRSDIFLDHATVSRSHVEFIRQGGRFVVRDAGSLNGVYVNGLRVDEAVLSTGDVVQVGRYRLTFFEGPTH